MLGLVVVCSQSTGALAPHALMEPLLGAPLLARAIASALPTDESVTGVLVVPADLVDRVRNEVVERFGLDEIDRVVAGGPDHHAAVLAGLEALPADVDFVIVTEGARALAPLGLVQRVVAAARKGDGAVPAVAPKEVLVADETGAVMVLDMRAQLRAVQGPQCFRVTSLKAALAQAASSAFIEVELLAQMGGSVLLVDGDVDNVLLREAADLSRALEVFSRRAVEFPFVYPRDLLPDDPLAKALDRPEGTVVSGAPVQRSDTQQ